MRARCSHKASRKRRWSTIRPGLPVLVSSIRFEAAERCDLWPLLNNVVLLCWVLQDCWLRQNYGDYQYRLHSTKLRQQLLLSLQLFSVNFFHSIDLSIYCRIAFRCSDGVEIRQMLINALPYWQTSILALLGCWKPIKCVWFYFYSLCRQPERAL